MKTNRELLEMLLDAINYSFYNPTTRDYNKELTYPVIDKVKYILRTLNENAQNTKTLNDNTREVLNKFENSFNKIIAPYKDSRNYRVLCKNLQWWKSNVWRWVGLKEIKEKENGELFEAEWKRYINSKGGGTVTVNIKDLAKHFAEWEKQRMIDKFNEWCQEEFMVHPHDPNVVQYVSEKPYEDIDDFVEEFIRKME